MSDVAEAIGKLRDYSGELDDLSRSMAKVARELEPVDDQYNAFIDSFDTGLWHRHLADDAKLPAEKMRVKLAREAMPPELLGRHAALVASQKRMNQRVGELKVLVEAQRSILSALKSELEAVR